MIPKPRVIAFVDGFNLYHAIDDLNKSHLKWVNLWKLCEVFAPGSDWALGQVYYFSAYAPWRKHERHREYVRALEAAGVSVVLGKFKDKDRRCRCCSHFWTDHEEKETDVNIALQLVVNVDNYDRALLISGDSDLGPAVRIVKTRHPDKRITIVAPVGRRHSRELIMAAGGNSNAASMLEIHVERSLFPQVVTDPNGLGVARRPAAYDPPLATRRPGYP